MISTIQDQELLEKLKSIIVEVVNVGKDELGLDPASSDINVRRASHQLEMLAEHYLYTRYVHESLPRLADLREMLNALITNAQPIITAMGKLPRVLVPTIEYMAEQETPEIWFGIPDDMRRQIEARIGEPDWDNAPSLEEALDQLGLTPEEKAQFIKESELEIEEHERFSLSDTMDNLQKLAQAAERLENEYGRKSTKQMYWRKFIWSVPAVIQGAPTEFREAITENQFIAACLSKLDPDLNAGQIKFMLGEARKEREVQAG